MAMMLPGDLDKLQAEFGQRMRELRDRGLPEDHPDRVHARLALAVLGHALAGDKIRRGAGDEVVQENDRLRSELAKRDAEVERLRADVSGMVQIHRENHLLWWVAEWADQLLAAIHEDAPDAAPAQRHKLRQALDDLDSRESTPPRDNRMTEIERERDEARAEVEGLRTKMQAAELVVDSVSLVLHTRIRELDEARAHLADLPRLRAAADALRVLLAGVDVQEEFANLCLALSSAYRVAADAIAALDDLNPPAEVKPATLSTVWRIDYSSDTGPGDDDFREWWEITDGARVYRCENEKHAAWLCGALNGHGTAEVKPDHLCGACYGTGETQEVSHLEDCRACGGSGCRSGAEVKPADGSGGET